MEMEDMKSSNVQVVREGGAFVDACLTQNVNERISSPNRGNAPRAHTKPGTRARRSGAMPWMEAMMVAQVTPLAREPQMKGDQSVVHGTPVAVASAARSALISSCNAGHGAANPVKCARGRSNVTFNVSVHTANAAVTTV